MGPKLRLVSSPAYRDPVIDEHLAELIQPLGGHEQMGGRLIRQTIIGSAVFTIIGIGWSAMATIDQVAVAQGTIEAIGQDRPVEIASTAEIAEVLVKPGDAVRKGQVLVRLDGAAVATELALAQQDRRTRELILQDLGPGGAQDAVRSAELRAASAALARVEGESAAVISQLRTASRAAAIARQDRDRSRRLFENEAISISALNQREAGLIEAEGREDLLRNQLRSMRLAAAESAANLVLLRQQQGAGRNQSVRQAQLGLAEARATEQIALRKAGQLQVVSPVAGVVKDVAFTPGRLVPAGTAVAVVTPRGTGLSAELLLPARAVRGVRPGSDVRLQPISESDGSDVIRGQVTSLSPSSFSNEQGRRYFKLTVRMEQDSRKGQSELAPGIEVVARIRTGETTVFNEVLRPVRTQLQRYFWAE